MSIYLKRYAWPEQVFTRPIDVGTEIIIVIPCFNEPELISTLESISKCAIPSGLKVRVLVVINHSEVAEPAIAQHNQKTLEQAELWIEQHESSALTFEARLLSLPRKHAGVGLARKIGMDDAVRLFESIDESQGAIVCLDADCQVAPNYLEAIHETFKSGHVNAASIFFEHGLIEDELSEGILRYEIFLRYYINALRRAGYPFSVHTIGSSMAVRSDIYQKAGGMNRRKAGEDFYFIHKLLPHGDFAQINTTSVYPSSRCSDRVPFGTGAAMNKWIDKTDELSTLYNPQTFEDLKVFINAINSFLAEPLDIVFQALPVSVQQFLNENEFEEELTEILSNVGEPATFRKRFFQWFDGLKVLKYVHHSRDHHHPDLDMQKSLTWVFGKELPLSESLTKLRELDRSNSDRIGL